MIRINNATIKLDGKDAAPPIGDVSHTLVVTVSRNTRVLFFIVMTLLQGGKNPKTKTKNNKTNKQNEKNQLGTKGLSKKKIKEVNTIPETVHQEKSTSLSATSRSVF